MMRLTEADVRRRSKLSRRKLFPSSRRDGAAARLRPARSRSIGVVALAASVLGIAAADAAGTKSGGGARVRPGIYLSASVALSLQPDGAFLVQELGGARQAVGRYESRAGAITFVNGDGDVGRTRFPFTCRVASVFGGFAVDPAQPGCRTFAGLTFRSAD